MTTLEIALVCGAAAVAAAVGAITGGHSLVGVPLLIFFGLEPTVAVATNMAGVAALSLGAAARFTGGGHVGKHPTIALTLLAIPGAVLGARITVELPAQVLQGIIATAMIALVVFIAMKPDWGSERSSLSRRRVVLGYAAATIWAVYGGLFSGGYTTVLTVLVVACFGTTLLEAVATTKWINLANSAAAVAVFAQAGVVDWQVALPYACAMAVGGVAGAQWASRVSARRLRQLLLTVVVAMAVRLLWRTIAG